MAVGLSPVSNFRSLCQHLNLPIASHTIISTNCRLYNSISAPNHPCFLSLIRTQQATITCAKKSERRGGSQPSRKLMLELASLALNLNIFPQPLNFLIGEFSQRDGNAVFLELTKVLRGGTLDGLRRKRKSRRKISWFVLVLFCGLGLMCWKISELDIFLKVTCFSLVGLSIIQLGRRKAFKEWILGFLFGIVLLSCKIGKEDMKFWVERLKIPSSVSQIVTERRSRRKWGKAW